MIPQKHFSLAVDGVATVNFCFGKSLINNPTVKEPRHGGEKSFILILHPGSKAFIPFPALPLQFRL